MPLALSIAALQFHASGGSLHGRYVLSGHAVVMIASAVWLTSLYRRTAWAIIATAGLLTLTNLALIWGVYLEDSGNWERTSIAIELPYLLGGATPVVLGVLNVLVAALFAVTTTRLLSIVPAVEADRPPARTAPTSATQVRDQPVGRVIRVEEPAPNIVK